MTLYVVPRRLRRPRRYLLAVVVVALAATAAVVASTLSRPSDAAARPLAGARAAVLPATGLEGVDQDLADRFAAARAAAAADGITLRVTSGKRSVAEQQKLVDDAVTKYGSTAEAHRWVLPPESSAHVQGLALDVGPTAGALWLGKHGVDFGLCRTYANEVWHFEKLPAGLTACPPMHDDSSWGWR
ncbi:M15 family metallopeptidase [Cellulomonas sp. McL0617]|uniref:M15 family metallopeptidase n=1 Tax=Cellulomonas sp. McL0617 TaxID=3415675 RepID=UPI003CEE79D9